MAAEAPPQLLPVFTDTPESIEAQIDTSNTARRQFLDQILSSQTLETVTFQDSLESITQQSEEASLLTRKILFYSKVSPDRNVRDASRKAGQIIRTLNNKNVNSSEIFAIIRTLYNKRHDISLNTKEDMRLLELRYREYTLDGFGLLPGSTEQSRLREIKTRITTLRDSFKRNLNEENGYILFTPEELIGVSNDILHSLETEQGKLRVTFKNHHFQAVLPHAKLPGTRKAYLIAAENKVRNNYTIVYQLPYQS